MATIADRIDCLLDLQQPIKLTKGIPVHDKLKLSIGDHPAEAFKRGSRIGGNFKCSSCGCLSSRMNDVAHVFSCHWRSLEDLQKLVLQRKFEWKASVLKPFDRLSKQNLLEELRRRGVLDVLGSKKELLSKLQSILMEVQWVPTILITNPSQKLADLNLQGYTRF